MFKPLNCCHNLFICMLLLLLFEAQKLRNVSLLQNNHVCQKMVSKRIFKSTWVGFTLISFMIWENKMTPAVISRLSVYCNSILSLTQPIVPLILIMFPPATAKVFEDHSYVTENDERRRKDRTFMEGHDQLVPLELPHLVRDGLHFKECVTVRIKDNISNIQDF